MTISLSSVDDFQALGKRWRALEEQAGGSFFQSWSWMGCLAGERFPDPILLTAEADGATVGLALFNRRRATFGRETLHLGESGDSSHDCPFIEHNGPLVACGREAETLVALLAASLHAATTQGAKCWGPRLMLSGVPPSVEGTLRDLGAATWRLAVRPSPFLPLAGPPLLDRVSAGTRYQIRRSMRLFAASGPLALSRAGSVEEAWDFLDQLAQLHQTSWRRRGRPGAFADPFFRRFHRELIHRAFPRGECDLLRVTAGTRVVGYLYNLMFRGRVLAYQSGFDYSDPKGQEKPGLVCHTLAINEYRNQAYEIYDFLGGTNRTKKHLSSAADELLWLAAAPRRSLHGLGLMIRGLRARLPKPSRQAPT